MRNFGCIAGADEAAAHSSSLVPPNDCIDCKKPLCNSYLWDKFNFPVCDTCRFSIYKFSNKLLFVNFLVHCGFFMTVDVWNFLDEKVFSGTNHCSVSYKQTFKTFTETKQDETLIIWIKNATMSFFAFGQLLLDWKS